MQTRIYAVKTTKNEGPATTRLVEASSQAQAIRHVVSGEYTAEIPTQKELVGLMAYGCRVEKAGETVDNVDDGSTWTAGTLTELEKTEEQFGKAHN